MTLPLALTHALTLASPVRAATARGWGLLWICGPWAWYSSSCSVVTNPWVRVRVRVRVRARASNLTLSLTLAVGVVLFILLGGYQPYGPEPDPLPFRPLTRTRTIPFDR